MTTPMKSMGIWRYNSASDTSAYYKMDENFVKNKYYYVELEEDSLFFYF